MRPALFVTLAALTLSALSGCGVHVHYSRGYASTSYGSTGIVWNQPAPPPTPVTMTPAPAGEVFVTGSDGSFGWQRACNADVEIHRVSERMAQANCQIESYGYDETRAICNGTRVVLRRDATHVYRLCPPGTDRVQCEAAWGSIR